ncbi:MAG: LytR/AlgR family response regulator transcription factor [Bacteroidota bacterium]
MIKALIVDDEPKSRDVLSLLLSDYFPEITIAGEAGSVTEAIDLLNKQHINLLFLDVEIPGGTGFTILEKVKYYNFKVIFTTSFSQYAIKAIRFAALDYLLKPIGIEEFKEAVNKAIFYTRNDGFSQLQAMYENLRIKKLQKLALPTLDGFEITEVDDIEYFEASNNYTNVFFIDGRKMLLSRTLKDFETLLTNEGFVRIHQSYLINMRHITRYSKGYGTVTTKNGHELAVAVRKKDIFIEQLKKL